MMFIHESENADDRNFSHYVCIEVEIITQSSIKTGTIRSVTQSGNKRTGNVPLPRMTGAQKPGQHGLHARQVCQLRAHVLELVFSQAAGFFAVGAILQSQ